MNSKRFFILLIDDDISLLDVLRQAASTHFPEAIFQQLIQVDAAKKYIASVDSALPKLVLLDLDFKEKQNGIDLLTYIRANAKYNAIPIVILTGSQSPQDVITAYKHGASSFTVKPATNETWGEYLRILRLYWLETVTLIPN